MNWLNLNCKQKHTQVTNLCKNETVGLFHRYNETCRMFGQVLYDWPNVATPAAAATTTTWFLTPVFNLDIFWVAKINPSPSRHDWHCCSIRRRRRRRRRRHRDRTRESHFYLQIDCFQWTLHGRYVVPSVTRLGDFLEYGQLFKAFGNNLFAQISLIFRQFL